MHLWVYDLTDYYSSTSNLYIFESMTLETIISQQNTGLNKWYKMYNMFFFFLGVKFTNLLEVWAIAN